MTVVLAALDDSPSAATVLGIADRIGALLGAPVRALHVGARLPDRLSAVAGPVRLARGEVVDALVAAGERPEVAVLVIGARGSPIDPRPLGSTAAGVATATGKPVVVVPPGADPHARVDRILVLLEGTSATSTAPAMLIDLALGATLDVVALHVIEPDRLPAFTDQPQHERTAWTREFLARYCPRGIDRVRLLTRVGRTEDVVPLVARQSHRGLIVLGWSQRFSPGRARVVRAVLRHAPQPVALIPLLPAG